MTDKQAIPYTEIMARMESLTRRVELAEEKIIALITRNGCGEFQHIKRTVDINEVNGHLRDGWVLFSVLPTQGSNLWYVIGRPRK